MLVDLKIFSWFGSDWLQRWWSFIHVNSRLETLILRASHFFSSVRGLFTNNVARLLSWCWPHLQALSFGGLDVDGAGLLAVGEWLLFRLASNVKTKIKIVQVLRLKATQLWVDEELAYSGAGCYWSREIWCKTVIAAALTSSVDGANRACGVCGNMRKLWTQRLKLAWLIGICGPSKVLLASMKTK